MTTNVVKVATKLEDCLTAHHVHHLKDIYNLEPYREYIVTCKMTKKDIEQLILSRFTAGNSEKGDMFDIYCCGFTYQVLAGSSTSITGSLKDGVTYTVAMGDYMCYNYDFPQKSEGKSTRTSVRQALISYIKEKKILVNTPPPKPPIIRITPDTQKPTNRTPPRPTKAPQKKCA